MDSTGIGDYALVGDGRTAALVSRAGSVDWLCAPRLDSPSLFGALLGGPGQGAWSLRPADPSARPTRRYDGDTFTLITRWETGSGVADVRDLMPMDHRRTDVARRTDLHRRVTGVSGRVRFAQELTLRFDYARATPWVRQAGTPGSPALLATAGPDSVIVRGAALRAAGHAHAGTLEVGPGQSVDLSLTWFPSHRPAPAPLDPEKAAERTGAWWQAWADRVSPCTAHRQQVVRSLLVLRALTNYDTGGIAAAATTSLPEAPGGSRNWDYRYVWLRDAALTLQALIRHGYLALAHHWREWLLRAVAGDPSQVQIMYGIGGERDLPEREVPSLPGHRGASPVRVGNGAHTQYQADVAGEVLAALADARDAGLAETDYTWALQRALVNQTAANMHRPDNGIWEIRGKPRKFTHSRAMMWAGLDAGIRAAADHGLDAPARHWRDARDRLRAEIDRDGVSPHGHFRQHYATDEVDASLLLLPQYGYCPPDDPRMLATVRRIEDTLDQDGLILRYRSQTGVDGLNGPDSPFLACSFWLARQYADTGRTRDAAELLDRVCGLANDVGLLSEEYDTRTRAQAGNTPQALSHLALIQAATALDRARQRNAVPQDA